MFRNLYDNDVSTWSPQGRLYQIEYAMEAVKQGSATVALKSKTHVVLCALKRAPSKLSAHQEKIGVIDRHLGHSMAGLASDARVLVKFMRLECISYRYEFGADIPCRHLMERLVDHCQPRTMLYGQRPFGVGLLLACYDREGTHLFQFCPSATYYDCRAMSLGARSQSAKTYFEKHLQSFDGCSREELIQHALRALLRRPEILILIFSVVWSHIKDTLPNDIELSATNCSIGVVGENEPFTVLDSPNDIDPYLERLKLSQTVVATEPQEEGTEAPEENPQDATE